MNEQDALEMLKGADIKEMLTFLVDMLAAYPTDELKSMKERATGSNEIMAGEEIVLVIDEILRLRGEL